MDQKAPDNVVSLDFLRAQKAGKPAPEPELSPTDAQKKRVFEHFLEAGVVTVAFDPRAPLVEVPFRFRHLCDLRLNFSYGYRIDDFVFDARGIRATLRFTEGYFCCFVPWPSLFAMHSEVLQRDSFWLKDAPKEIQAELKRVEQVIEKPKATKPRLSLVESDDDDEIA